MGCSQSKGPSYEHPEIRPKPADLLHSTFAKELFAEINVNLRANSSFCKYWINDLYQRNTYLTHSQLNSYYIILMKVQEIYERDGWVVTVTKNTFGEGCKDIDPNTIARVCVYITLPDNIENINSKCKSEIVKLTKPNSI